MYSILYATYPLMEISSHLITLEQRKVPVCLSMYCMQFCIHGLIIRYGGPFCLHTVAGSWYSVSPYRLPPNSILFKGMLQEIYLGTFSTVDRRLLWFYINKIVPRRILRQVSFCHSHYVFTSVEKLLARGESLQELPWNALNNWLYCSEKINHR